MAFCNVLRWIGVSALMFAAFLLGPATSQKAVMAQAVPPATEETEKLDSQPLQVLIEATIVEIEADDADIDKHLSKMTNTGDASDQPESPSATTDPIPTGVANALHMGFVSAKPTDVIQELEKLGKTKVLACPRLLVLNKQRAELHVDSDTQLRLRPFVSSNDGGNIRLEIRLQRETKTRDENGVDQTNALQITSNVMFPDGNTVFICQAAGDGTQQTDEDKPSAEAAPAKKQWVTIVTAKTWQDVPERKAAAEETTHEEPQRIPTSYY